MNLTSKQLRLGAAAALAVLVTVGFSVTVASAATYIHVDVRSGGDQAGCVLEPGTRSGYAADYQEAEVYRGEGGWYSCRGRNWFWSRAHRGPWMSVGIDRVPRQLLGANRHYRRYHHGMYEDRDSRHLWKMKREHHDHGRHGDEDRDRDRDRD